MGARGATRRAARDERAGRRRGSTAAVHRERQPEEITFGYEGVANFNFNPGGRGVDVWDLELVPDGSLYALSSDSDEFISRFDENGNPDIGFGSGGIAGVSPVSARMDVDDGGSPVVAGQERFGEGGELSRTVVTRYTANGDRDGSFGTNGSTVLSASSLDRPRDVLIQPDGRIVVVGSVNSSVLETFLLRLNPSGKPDQGFGDNSRCGPSPFQHRRQSWRGRIGCGGENLGGRGCLCAGGAQLPPRDRGSALPRRRRASMILRTKAAMGVASPEGLAPAAGASASHKLLSPRSFYKLSSRGIRALVSCQLDCRAVLEVKVTKGVAAEIGLPGTLVAQGSRTLGAGKRGWVVATLNGSARRALQSYAGGGKFKVKVAGLAP